MRLAVLPGLVMRTQAIWLCCGLALAGCLPSAFGDAEQRERERLASSWLVVDAGMPDSGPADERASEGQSAAGSGSKTGAAASGGMSAIASGSVGAGGAAAARGSAGALASAWPATPASAGAHALPSGGSSSGASGAGDAAGGGEAVRGQGGQAGQAGQAGASDGGGLAGAAGAAADGGEPGHVDAGTGGDSTGSGCGDTSSDTANCGGCGNDCSADKALAICIDSHCQRACIAGLADCNMDLAMGSEGDGCEIDLANDASHCGRCDIRCEPSLGFCEARQCKLRAIEVGDGSPVAQLHGNATGGDAYEEVCGHDEALIGIDVASNGDYIWGFAARCAPLSPTGTVDAFSIEVGAPHELPLLGNRATPTQMPMTIDCPSGMLVSGVNGATGYFLPDNQLLSLKTLTLICARPSMSAGKLELEPSSRQSAGSLMGSVAEPFADICSAGELVVGFSGRAGDVIDALTTVCAPLQIGERAQ